MSEILIKYPDVLTTKHLVEITGLSANTITQMARSGEIPAKKTRKVYLFAKPLIVKWLMTETEPEEIDEETAAKIATLR